jgi:hypothetical protein
MRGQTLLAKVMSVVVRRRGTGTAGRRSREECGECISCIVCMIGLAMSIWSEMFSHPKGGGTNHSLARCFTEVFASILLCRGVSFDEEPTN